jgi:hypothetical protein
MTCPSWAKWISLFEKFLELYASSLMVDYMYIIVLLKTRTFGVVFTNIWLPKCFWRHKHRIIFKCIFW